MSKEKSIKDGSLINLFDSIEDVTAAAVAEGEHRGYNKKEIEFHVKNVLVAKERVTNAHANLNTVLDDAEKILISNKKRYEGKLDWISITLTLVLAAVLTGLYYAVYAVINDSSWKNLSLLVIGIGWLIITVIARHNYTISNENEYDCLQKLLLSINIRELNYNYDVTSDSPVVKFTALIGEDKDPFTLILDEDKLEYISLHQYEWDRG